MTITVPKVIPKLTKPVIVASVRNIAQIERLRVASPLVRVVPKKK